jgi:hypothetical protein
MPTTDGARESGRTRRAFFSRPSRMEGPADLDCGWTPL